jgi:uncharacterized NAD-dependent epimerase/dehydratase family protein
VTDTFDGNAVVYCEGAFNTPNGKTAHGLVRFTERYRILSVVDSRYAGRDAGEVLDGARSGIPVVATVSDAVRDAGQAGVAGRRGAPGSAEDAGSSNFAGRAGASGRAGVSGQAGAAATHLVVGLAPDGGRLSAAARDDVKRAIELGLNVDCGLHDFLSEDPEISKLAAQRGVTLRDVRKTPPRSELHFFSGKIEEVTSLKIALLGTDSAIGKRTTAWILIHGLRSAGCTAELVGTGQTAWMQGARYTILLDSLINDFVSGEIEHAVWSAWHDVRPDVIVIEGQGSLMNPAYPGGFEILAAGRPDAVVLQHAPARKDYDGFPGYPIHPLPRQIQAVEVISGRPVVAVTVNHEDIPRERIADACAAIERETGLPAVDPLHDGAERLVNILKPLITRRPAKRA